MSDEPAKTPPTHYFTKTSENGVDSYDIKPISELVPEGDVTYICVDANQKDAPVQSIVDKDGKKIEESIPDGLQDAVKAVLNPTTGGRRRRSRRQSRRQSKRRSKRQNGGRRKRDSKRRQRR